MSNGLRFYVLDVESTGLNSATQEMTEIGIIRCTDRVQLWRNIKCLTPWTANFDALQITGKTMADLEKGYDREQVVNECEQFFAEDGLTSAHRCIVGHNISFDRKFLHALWGACGKEFPAHLWLDTMTLTRAWAKKQGIVKPKVNLHAACDLLGVKKLSTAHNAKVDSRNAYLLHRNLVEDKKIDYLPFIKTAVHVLAASSEEEECGLDPALLDIE